MKKDHPITEQGMESIVIVHMGCGYIGRTALIMACFGGIPGIIHAHHYDPRIVASSDVITQQQVLNLESLMFISREVNYVHIVPILCKDKEYEYLDRSPTVTVSPFQVPETISVAHEYRRARPPLEFIDIAQMLHGEEKGSSIRSTFEFFTASDHGQTLFIFFFISSCIAPQTEYDFRKGHSNN